MLASLEPNDDNYISPFHSQRNSTKLVIFVVITKVEFNGIKCHSHKCNNPLIDIHESRKLS